MSSKSDRGTKRPKLEKERKPKGDPVTKDCGCVEQAYDDGTVDVNPCAAHALVQTANVMLEMAENLKQAANSLGYAGMQLDRQLRGETE